MSRRPDSKDYVTKIDPCLSRTDGPLQVLRSPGPAPEPEAEPEMEIEP
jgi:hypothetical protein